MENVFNQLKFVAKVNHLEKQNETQRIEHRKMIYNKVCRRVCNEGLRIMGKALRMLIVAGQSNSQEKQNNNTKIDVTKIHQINKFIAILKNTKNQSLCLAYNT